jgi:hypothetical protein
MCDLLAPFWKVKDNECRKERRENRKHSLSMHSILGTMSHLLSKNNSHIVQMWKLEAHRGKWFVHGGKEHNKSSVLESSVSKSMLCVMEFCFFSWKEQKGEKELNDGVDNLGKIQSRWQSLTTAHGNKSSKMACMAALRDPADPCTGLWPEYLHRTECVFVSSGHYYVTCVSTGLQWIWNHCKCSLGNIVLKK